MDLVSQQTIDDKRLLTKDWSHELPLSRQRNLVPRQNECACEYQRDRADPNRDLRDEASSLQRTREKFFVPTDLIKESSTQDVAQSFWYHSSPDLEIL